MYSSTTGSDSTSSTSGSDSTSSTSGSSKEYSKVASGPTGSAVGNSNSATVSWAPVTPDPFFVISDSSINVFF